MAEVISTVASAAITNLGSKAFQEFTAACHSEWDLKNLTETIERVKLVLNADEIGQPHGFKGLIDGLKGAVEDYENLQKKINTLAEQKRHGGFTHKVRNFFSLKNPIANTFFIPRDIKRIQKSLEHIFLVRQRIPVPSRELVQPRTEASSFVLVGEVVGRDDDKRKVLHILFDRHDDPRTPPVVVLPIVGTGGLGKTTLAQLAYHDEDVKNHFEIKKWVHVGDKFNLEDIIRSLVGGSSLVKIQDEFRTKMGGKKYLFVLDDVWEENPLQLSPLQSLLSVGAKGSRVIVTTQSMDTALRIGTISPLGLQRLSDEDSWKLFAKVAFGAGWHSEQQQNPFVQTGKEIAKKCKNLPLVIKVVASLLRGRDETKWKYFRDNDLTSINDAANTILPLLKLSYSRLSSELKQCFLYCSLFPKGSRIGRVQICHLWMAQGFIPSSSQDSKVSLEDDADQCFKKLLNRSFFQDIVWDEWGEIESFKMHDCLHDLARQVAGKAILRVDGELTDVLPADTRHFSVGKLSLTSNLPSYLHKEGKKLLTFRRPYFYFGGTLPWEVSALVSRFSDIMVLELFDLRIKQLPDSIGTLTLLRYLNLSGNDFVRLPTTFTRLHDLETLNLSRCNNLLDLPSDLCKLGKLQSLDIMACEKLLRMPPGMRNMTRLKRLTTFVVGSAVSNQTGCCRKLPTINDASGFDDLSRLENLRGRLDIRFKRNGNGNRVPSIGTKADCLRNKSNLAELNIDMKNAGYVSEDVEELLKWLQPPENIRSFSLLNYRERTFPSWVTTDDLSACLPNLVCIKLLCCDGCRHLPILSQLRFLKSLQLETLSKVEYIDESTASTSATFFPSLESLFLYDLPNLKGWRKPTATETTELGGYDERRGARPLAPPSLSAKFFASFKSLFLYGLPILKGWRKPTATETTELGGYDEQHGAQPLAPPSFRHLSSLHIRHCHKMTSMPLCPSLKELYLVGCSKELRVMETGEWNSAGYLSNPPPPPSSKTLHTASTPSPLWRLTVNNTEYLNYLPKPCLHSLTTLRIEHGREAILFSGSFLQHLTGLENLSVYDVEEVKETDETAWRSLGRLRRLEFNWVEKLTTLPKWIEYLTNLQELRIRDSANLEELPERISLVSSSLRRLEIFRCGLKALPQGIGDLTSLQYLSLHLCSGLVKRCRKPDGEDWPKIKHVPEIKLPDGEVVHGG